VYCRAYKQAPVGQAHGLLRKARRLDALLNRSSEPTPSVLAPSTPPELRCCYCATRYSPAFYKTANMTGHRSSDGGYWQCHRCKFMEEHGIDEKLSPSSSADVNGVAKDIATLMRKTNNTSAVWIIMQGILEYNAMISASGNIKSFKSRSRKWVWYQKPFLLHKKKR
jgi:hypothetical protein